MTKSIRVYKPEVLTTDFVRAMILIGIQQGIKLGLHDIEQPKIEALRQRRKVRRPQENLDAG